MKKDKVRLTKIFMLFSGVIALVMCVALGAFSLYLYQKDIIARYYEIVGSSVGIAADSLDGDDIRSCIEKGEMSQDLLADRSLMDIIKTKANIAYMYMIYFPDESQKDSMNYILYANTEQEREEGIPDSTINAPAGDEYAPQLWDAFYNCQFGTDSEIRFQVNQLRPADSQYLVPAVTAYCPIYDSQGVAVGVLGADIYAYVIASHTRSYILSVVIFGLAILILGIFGYRKISETYIIHPITRLADSAKSFVAKTKTVESPNQLTYEVIEVKQDTEIRDLANELATMMGAIKDYMVNLRDVTAEKERIGAELNLATKIQADMLPRIFPPFPNRNEFILFASMDPAKEVGGDFYDFFFTDKDHFAMVMADVSGKGVPAALFMVIAKTLIKNTAQSHVEMSPGEILEEVNNQLCQSNSEELFVTVWLGIVDLNTGKGMAANAGHEHPALRRKGGDFELVVYRHSPAVATMDGIPFREHAFELKPGDTLFVYTDGVAEATNAQNELYGTDRMLAAMNRDHGRTPEQLLLDLRKDIDDFVLEAPQFDDITMLCFDYKGPEKAD